MADVYLNHPEGLFELPAEWAAFLNTLQGAVAEHMSGKNPKGKKVTFNPDADIPVFSTAYNPLTSRPTALLTITLVSYDWRKRTKTMHRRLAAVCTAIRPHIVDIARPEGVGLVEIKFMTKPEGCWYALTE